MIESLSNIVVLSSGCLLVVLVLHPHPQSPSLLPCCSETVSRDTTTLQWFDALKGVHLAFSTWHLASCTWHLAVGGRAKGISKGGLAREVELEGRRWFSLTTMTLPDRARVSWVISFKLVFLQLQQLWQELFTLPCIIGEWRPTVCPKHQCEKKKQVKKHCGSSTNLSNLSGCSSRNSTRLLFKGISQPFLTGKKQGSKNSLT